MIKTSLHLHGHEHWKSQKVTSFIRFQTKRHFWLLRDRPFLCFSAIDKIYIQFSVNSPDLALVSQKELSDLFQWLVTSLEMREIFVD